MYVDKMSLCDVVPTMHIGGGRVPLFKLEELLPHIDLSGKHLHPGSSLKFVGHKHKNVVESLYKDLDDHIYRNVPPHMFLPNLTLKDAKSIAKSHGLHVQWKAKADDIATLFVGHLCGSCDTHISVFALHVVKYGSARSKKWYNGLDESGKKKKTGSGSVMLENQTFRGARKLQEKKRNEMQRD